jgi:hypothetical protein
MAYREMMFDYPALNESVRDQFIQETGDAFGKVLALYGDHSAQVVEAHVGLALLAETQRDFDAAAKHYQAAIDKGEQVLPSLVELAKSNLANLDVLRQPIAFANVPVTTDMGMDEQFGPDELVPTQPAAGPAPADAAPTE